MIILPIPKKKYQSEGNTIKRKIHTSYVNYSSSIFSRSICAMYNIFCCSQKQHLMLNSYITAVDSYIGTNICYHFSG